MMPEHLGQREIADAVDRLYGKWLDKVGRRPIVYIDPSKPDEVEAAKRLVRTHDAIVWEKCRWADSCAG